MHEMLIRLPHAQKAKDNRAYLSSMPHSHTLMEMVGQDMATDASTSKVAMGLASTPSSTLASPTGGHIHHQHVPARQKNHYVGPMVAEVCAGNGASEDRRRRVNRPGEERNTTGAILSMEDNQRQSGQGETAKKRQRRNSEVLQRMARRSPRGVDG